MARKKKPTFTPATKFKVTKLSPNGPKPGQNISSWEQGKEQADKRWDKQRTKNIDKLL